MQFTAAVTGTNGKTSTVWFLQKIWEFAGYESASIGTLGLVSGNRISKKPFSTHINDLLELLYLEGYTHMAFEAFSVGLDVGYYDDVDIQAAAFTNLSHDHLDYHGSLAAYGAAKQRLFSEILQQGTAVININEDFGKQLLSICKSRNLDIIRIGEGGEFSIIKSQIISDGMEVEIKIFNQNYFLKLPFFGNFMLINALSAIGLAFASGIEIENAIEAITKISLPPGRLEKIADYNNAEIYVDYAHTPDALTAVLLALKKRCQNRIILIIGCGGNRDSYKRVVIGKTASELSDLNIVTDDNPRKEKASNIRQQIMSQCPHALEIADRRDAICYGVSILQPGDVLLIAGKGHETFQEVAGNFIPFNDKEEVLLAIKN